MSRIELLELSTKLAKKYRLNSKESLVRNSHLTKIYDSSRITQIEIDAILTDFINFMGVTNGVDYALSIHDLRSQNN